MLGASLATVALAAGVVTGVASQPTTAVPARSPLATARSRIAGVRLPGSDTKLLGQRIMVGMQGTVAARGLLRRVREGDVGAVILFSQNIVSRRQLLALTGALQRAAGQGGNPPLLIATDQEGGQVKRLPQGPPALSPPQITATGSIALASREGRATGGYLRGLGINVDLAPVVDVPTFSGAFIWQQGRAFSFSPSTVASYGTAFALGVQSAHAAATAKHFPGIGSAPIDTDNKRERLRPSKAQLRQALTPYRALIARGVDAIMLSTAGFPAYDATGASAALSRPIVQGLLRGALGFRGVAITDALGTPTGHDERTAGVLAARAGADILLYTDSAPGTLPALIAELRRGRIGRAEADAAYARIVALKRLVTGH
jgi:beta-N-acetylhexosaminidase